MIFYLFKDFIKILTHCSFEAFNRGANRLFQLDNVDAIIESFGVHYHFHFEVFVFHNAFDSRQRNPQIVRIKDFEFSNTGKIIHMIARNLQKGK